MQAEQVSRAVEQVIRQMGIAPQNQLEASDHTITLAQAKRLIEAVQLKAREMGVKAVVAVYNSGARPVAVECMDDAYIASYDIAVNKAYTAVALKMSTKQLSELAAPNGPLYGIQHTNQGQIVIFGGGEPLQLGGKVIGGLGVSGGSEAQDTALAAYGKQAFDRLVSTL